MVWRPQRCVGATAVRLGHLARLHIALDVADRAAFGCLQIMFRLQSRPEFWRGTVASVASELDSNSSVQEQCKVSRARAFRSTGNFIAASRLSPNSNLSLLRCYTRLRPFRKFSSHPAGFVALGKHARRGRGPICIGGITHSGATVPSSTNISHRLLPQILLMARIVFVNKYLQACLFFERCNNIIIFASLLTVCLRDSTKLSTESVDNPEM